MPKHFLINNLGMTLFYSCLFLTNLIVFLLTFFLHESDWCLAGASALGKVLLLDSALLPITVCRRILAWVRETPLHAFSPLQNHRSVHRTLSLAVCIVAVVHAVSAVGHYYIESKNPGSPSLLNLLFNTRHQSGWLNLGLLNISGFACLLVVLIIVITSLLRHHITFLAFFLTHQLYVVLYALMIIHAGNLWIYLVVPVCLWSAELLLRLIHSPHSTTLMEVTLLPSNTMVLVLERSPQMIFKPGDYIFIQIPTIGRFEWVKFAITSAPEQQDMLTIHVQIKNNWTSRLRNHFLRDISYHYIPHRLHVLESITAIQRLHKSCRNMCGGFQNIEVPMGKPRETRKERMQRNQVDTMVVEEKHLTMDVVLSNDDLEPETVRSVLLPASARPPAASTGPLAAELHPTASPSATHQHDHPLESAEASQFAGFVRGYSTFTQTYGKTVHLGASAYAMSRGDYRHNRHSLVPTLNRKDAAPRGVDGAPAAPPPAGSLPVADTPSQVSDAETQQVGQGADDGRGATAPSSGALKLPVIDVNRATLSAPASRKQMVPPHADEDTSIVSSMKQQRRRDQQDSACPSDDESCVIDTTIKVLIDGPFGSSGNERTGIFSPKHAVLVLVGPEVESFASVLQSILIRYRSEIVPCPNCALEFRMQLPSSFMNIRKVDFVWVNSDMEGLEWFLELLEDMDNYQQNRSLLENFLEYYLYKTGIKPMPSFTPLRKKLQQGRPKWDELLPSIAERSPGGLEVFFSGPKTVGKVVRKACVQLEIAFNNANM